MTTQSNCLVFSGIAPHPPIMVPEVGRESIAGVRDSIEAMTELSERLIASGAESVILISPHAPLEADQASRELKGKSERELVRVVDLGGRTAVTSSGAAGLQVP